MYKRQSPKRLEAHKLRLKKAAKALSYPFDETSFATSLLLLKIVKTAQRVRLTLNSNGIFNLTHSGYVDIKALKFSISKYALSPKVQASSHKISHRHFYDAERERVKALTGADEVVFLNEKNELCEGSFTSLFIEKDGQLFTPPLSAGLLPGILRAEFLETRQALEKTITVDDLNSADKIYLGNSLRGLILAKLIDTMPR